MRTATPPTRASVCNAWRAADPETQAAVPPLMLKAAIVEEGRISEWVVRSELRPLLELCVLEPVSAYSIRLRYSA